MASSAAAADDQSVGLFAGIWSRLRAAASAWRRRGQNEGEEAIASSRLARRRLGRKLAFVSFNLEVLVFIYAFWRARRRNLNWRQPIQALPMLVIPALATLIYAVFVRFTRTFDRNHNKIIQRLQEEKQANHCGLKEFDQDEENSAKKYDWTDDPSNFSSGITSAETSKLGTPPQPVIDLIDSNQGDMAWDHNNDFQPTHSVEEICMTSSNEVIQPIDWLTVHLTDDPKHLDDTPMNVGDHCNSGTDAAQNNMVCTSAETGTCLLDCNIDQITSNTMDHAECSSPMNNPKYNGENSEAFAELLDEITQEIKSSNFLVSEENGMYSTSKTDRLAGSYAVKSPEQHLGTSGFSLCSQDNEKEDGTEGVCFVRVSSDLTLLSSPVLVVEGNKYAHKKESCELNTQYENAVAVDSEEEASVVRTDEQCSGTPGFFLHAEDSNMLETPAFVDIVAISPEANHPAPVESLTHAPGGGDFKGDETSNVLILEQKGRDVFLDSLVVDSYEDSFVTSKLLSHSEAATMTKVLGEDLSESLDKGASNHQNDVPFFSYYGSNTDNVICDSMSAQLITESNIMEALQGDWEILSDPVHQKRSHSAGISLSSSKVNNDEAYSSNSCSYFLYANFMEDEAPPAGLAGCSESKGGMNFAFLDTPIFLNEVTSAESWTDNSGCSQYIQHNASTESFHDGNQVQTKTSERTNLGLEESLISLEEGIKSEIFSLYSRSSSCVSDVNMTETLDVIAFPKQKNDNNFSIDEMNSMMILNMFHTDSYTNNSRSAEFIADVNMTENHNGGKGAGAGSLHGGDFRSGTIGDIQCIKETSCYAQPGLSMSQDDEFTPYSTSDSDGISNAENYLTSDSDLHNTSGSHCFTKNTCPKLQPQEPLSFRKAVVDQGEVCVFENNPDNSKSSLSLHMNGYQRVPPGQQDETNLGFEETDMDHCISDSNIMKNLEIVLQDCGLGVGTSFSVDDGKDFENSSYNSGSVMHTADMNTDNLQDLHGVDEKAVVSVSQHDADTMETNRSNWIYAEATMTEDVQDVNKHPSHSRDDPMTSFSSGRDSNSMNHANYSMPSPLRPDENFIQISGAVQEGSFEIHYEYPCRFEETSTSGDYSYNNPMSASHASMKASVRSFRKELSDLVLENIDRFDEIAGDEMSNVSQNENEICCEQIAITQAETHYTKIQDCVEASNIDSTKDSESVIEGLFETEHRGPELVLSQVGIPFIGDGKETETDCGSSNTVSSHHETGALETRQELPIAAGLEKGLLEDRNVCGCSCIDKEPKDLGINDIENDVEDLDEDHKSNPIVFRSS